MKAKIRFIAVFISACLIIGVSGCMSITNRTDRAKKEMVEYMEKRYNEKFETVNTNTQVWSADYIELILKSKCFPNASVVVRRSNQNGEMSDNYLTIKLNSDIEKIMSEIVSIVYGENRVYNLPKRTVISAGISPDITAENLLIEAPNITDLAIFVTKSSVDKENDLERFADVLKEYGYAPTFTIYYIIDDALKKIDEDNYIDFLSKNKEEIIVQGEFVIDSSMTFSYRNWRE